MEKNDFYLALGFISTLLCVIDFNNHIGEFEGQSLYLWIEVYPITFVFACASWLILIINLYRKVKKINCYLDRIIRGI